MNKLAQYLNQHLLGEVVTDKSILDKVSVDGGPFTIRPEIVVYPRGTNDIRKLARFAYKLAEKGHPLGLTVRGAGTNTVGAAIGEGIIIATGAHMNQVFELDVKQRLVRLQPGVSTEGIQNALALQGMELSGIDDHSPASVGGLIASNRAFETDTWVDQMEVVLSNGDVLQTKRLNKRELGRKKGEQSFEADIYRAIDTLIEENQELIDGITDTDVSGYAAIRQVKHKDGSLDLSPLFFASQGTLGIISELIVKTDFKPGKKTLIAASFENGDQARDLLDELDKIGVFGVEYYDQTLIRAARAVGKTLDFIPEGSEAKVLLAIRLDDPSARAQSRKQKKILKLIETYQGIALVDDGDAESKTRSVAHLATSARHSVEQGVVFPIADGIYVPLEQFDRFTKGLEALAKQRNVELSYWGRPFEGIWYVNATIDFKTVSGKQLVMKLVDELGKLVVHSGGSLTGESGEGRLYAYSTHAALDDQLKELYEKIRAIFDPRRILNPGVKASPDLSKLVKALRSDYSSGYPDGLPR